jgi:hypothetical protein
MTVSQLADRDQPQKVHWWYSCRLVFSATSGFSTVARRRPIPDLRY